MKIFLLLVIGLMILGCTTQQTPVQSIGEPQTPLGQTEYVNTSGLSFERPAGDVLTENLTFEKRPEFNFTNTRTNDGKLIVYYFYLPGCPSCIAIKPEIDRMEENYPEVYFIRYNLATINGSWAYKDFSDQFGLNKSQMYVPQVLVNKTIITDRFNINDSLEKILIGFGG
ncbi:MAG: thioredoxin family protein [Candidatus Micrarchaeota archaeon]